MPPTACATVALIGAEHEENMSLRYLAAAARQAGFEATIIAYDDVGDRDAVVESVLSSGAILVGISVPFQFRAAEFLSVAGALRTRGYRGHVTVGGHFATFEYENILRAFPAIDSVVRHEGEETFAEVCALVARGESVGPIPGLIVREARSKRLPILGEVAPRDVRIGPKRPLPPLDDLPFPERPARAHDVLGVRAAPMVGSRGCYADCSFCCIYAYADNAEGARYRMRSPENIVKEMKEDYARRGTRIFVFHDDNFFVPHTPKNLVRYRRMAELLRAEGMTDLGLVIKCRPNDVDRELFALLKDMGMIRAYVGIETNSDEGVVSLNRRITPEDNLRAMLMLRELEVYSSFNVLIFDPESTLDGVERNLDFMARFADVPFNFCRAEVYAGTPLKTSLETEGRLRGSYLAWTYAMRDPRVELLFRLATTAFYGRNFKSDGLANLNMGLRFDLEVLRRFYPRGWDARFAQSLQALSRAIGEDTIDHMRRAVAFVRNADLRDHAGANAFTLTLARGVARSDLSLLRRVKEARRQIEMRALLAGASGLAGRFGHGMPVWAAETGRLGTSVGRDLSTELLPSPSGVWN